jgi:hypothetical protein
MEAHDAYIGFTAWKQNKKNIKSTRMKHLCHIYTTGNKSCIAAPKQKV